MIDSVTTIGDAGDISCWSGTPYHFAQAAGRIGWRAEPWRLDMRTFVWPRRIWNMERLLSLRGAGGYQYSGAFARRAMKAVDGSLLSGRVLSFNQHFPPTGVVEGSGGRVCFYLDATFPLLLERYGVGRNLS